MEEKSEKSIIISGICTNCNKEKNCVFIMEIVKFSEMILDSEISVYSCKDYDSDKDILSENVCLSCK